MQAVKVVPHYHVGCLKLPAGKDDFSIKNEISKLLIGQKDLKKLSTKQFLKQKFSVTLHT